MPVQVPSVKSPSRQENTIRVKNVVRQAERGLGAFLGDRDGRRIAAEPPAWMLPLYDARARAPESFDRRAEGIAFFLSPGLSTSLPVPTALEQVVCADSRFHLKPLFACRSLMAEYYLLALDLHDVQLYRGDAVSLEPVALQSKRSLPDILEEFDFERSLNRDPGTETIYLGHAGGSENVMPYVVELLKSVDSAVLEIVSRDHLPVVLAGTESVVGHYRHHSELSGLTEQYVRCSPRTLDDGELHARAGEIVAPVQQARADRVVDAVAQGLATGRGSQDVAELCAAAHQGRLQLLLVAADETLTGTFDPGASSVAFSADGTDLLDLAAGDACRSGADVYALPRSRIPWNGLAAGVYHTSP